MPDTFLKLSHVQTVGIIIWRQTHIFTVIYSLPLRRPTNNLLLCLAASYKKSTSFQERLHLCPPNSGVCITNLIGLLTSTKDTDATSREFNARLYKIFLQYSGSLPYSARLTRLISGLSMFVAIILTSSLASASSMDLFISTYTSFFSPRLNSVTRDRSIYSHKTPCSFEH